MRVCVLHAAKDLRLEERPTVALEAHQVRVRFGAGGTSAARTCTTISTAAWATSRCASR